MKPLHMIPFTLFAATTGAQNLVPNGSFEEYVDCPDSFNQVARAVGWSSFGGTPDYFNECDTTGFVDVPLNFACNRYAADGVGYAGLLAWTFGIDQEREFCGVALTSPLVPGAPVYLSFKLMATTNGLQQNCRWTVDGVGVRFSTVPYDVTDSPLPNNAAIFCPTAPVDMSNWTIVSGSFLPDSAYSYAVLGGFFEDALLTPVEFNPTGNFNRAYMLIDDICVSYSLSECDLGQGLSERSQPYLSASPNPFSSSFELRLRQSYPSSAEVWIQDLFGSRKWTGQIAPGTDRIRVEGLELPDGAYFLGGSTERQTLQRTVVVHVSP